MFAVVYASTATAVCYYDVRRMIRSYVRPWLVNPDYEIARRAKLRGRHQRGYGRHLMRYMPRRRKILAPLSIQLLPDLPMPTDGTEDWLVEPSKPAASRPSVPVPELPTTAELRLPFMFYNDTAVIDMTEAPAVTDAFARIMREQEPTELAVR